MGRAADSPPVFRVSRVTGGRCQLGEGNDSAHSVGWYVVDAVPQTLSATAEPATGKFHVEEHDVLDSSSMTPHGVEEGPARLVRAVQPDDGITPSLLEQSRPLL